MANAADQLAPWEIVYQQANRWLKAGVFETMAHDLRELLPWLQGRDAHANGAHRSLAPAAGVTSG